MRIRPHLKVNSRFLAVSSHQMSLRLSARIRLVIWKKTPILQPEVSLISQTRPLLELVDYSPIPLVGHLCLAVIQLLSSSLRQPLLQVPLRYFQVGASSVGQASGLLQVLSSEVPLYSLRLVLQLEESSVLQEDKLAPVVNYSVIINLSSVGWMLSTQIPRKLKGMKMRILEMKLMMQSSLIMILLLFKAIRLPIWFQERQTNLSSLILSASPLRRVPTQKFSM